MKQCFVFENIHIKEKSHKKNLSTTPSSPFVKEKVELQSVYTVETNRRTTRVNERSEWCRNLYRDYGVTTVIRRLHRTQRHSTDRQERPKQNMGTTSDGIMYESS